MLQTTVWIRDCDGPFDKYWSSILSQAILNIWSERERKLIETSRGSLKLCEDLYPLANLPTSENCLLGKAIFLFGTRRAVFPLSSARGFGCTETARTTSWSIKCQRCSN